MAQLDHLFNTAGLQGSSVRGLRVRRHLLAVDRCPLISEAWRSLSDFGFSRVADAARAFQFVDSLDSLFAVASLLERGAIHSSCGSYAGVVTFRSYVLCGLASVTVAWAVGAASGTCPHVDSVAYHVRMKQVSSPLFRSDQAETPCSRVNRSVSSTAVLSTLP